MRNLKILSCAVAVIAVAVTLIAGNTASADSHDTADSCTEIDGYTVCTTRPWEQDDKTDTAIVDEISRRISEAGDGATIRIAMYFWKRTELAEDLVAARGRGVDVRAVIGLPSTDPDVSDEVRKILADGDVATTVCERSCLPNKDGEHKAVMHNKFVTIEDGGSTSVLVSSSNLATSQYQHAQNMVVSEDDKPLYDHYTAYWDRMAAKDWKGWTDADKSATGTKDTSKAYALPRYSGNVIAQVLDNVDGCREGSDRVWVTANVVGNEDARAKLIELQELGCDVKVAVTHAEDKEWMQEPVSGVGRLDPDKIVHFELNHNKIIIVDAEYSGQWRKVLFVGSHNFSQNSLRNANDNMLRLINTNITDHYIEFFRDMYNY